MLPSIRFGADWRTLARLRNVALYCLRHIVQCNANCLRAEPLLGVGTAISAEVNRSGKIKKSVALVLCQLRWRQLHRLLREPDAAALSVAPNGSGGARYQESKALAHRELPMTTPQPFAYFAATADFKTGKGTPRDFLERCLTLLEQFEPTVGAFVCHDIAAACAAADRASERWRAGRPLSPIDGMPVGIKDIIETADMPTEQGSPLFVGWRTGRDAASVAALREAGAVILGKVVTTEFAASEPRGTRNPWDPTRTPGGSSSGSAAAGACGMVPAALGTQVVGSILRPASFCGCVGFKPSVGGINRGGSYDYFSQSCTGVLAASLE